MSIGVKKTSPFITTNPEGVILYNCRLCGYLEEAYFYQTNIKRRNRRCIKCHTSIIKISRAKLKSVSATVLARIRHHFRNNQQLLNESDQRSNLCLELNGIDRVLKFWNNTSALSGISDLLQETLVIVVFKSPYPILIREENVILVTHSESKVWNKLTMEKRKEVFGVNVIETIEKKLEALSKILYPVSFTQNNNTIIVK